MTRLLLAFCVYILILGVSVDSVHFGSSLRISRGGIALLDDGTVWSSYHWYTSSYSARPAGLREVKTLYSTDKAWAALLENRSVVAWGSTAHGGNAPAAVKSTEPGVRLITTTTQAFCALHYDQTLTCWGSGNGEVSPPGLQRVISLFTNGAAICALKSDGTISVWGNIRTSSLSGISGVQYVFSTSSGFAPITHDGTLFILPGTKRVERVKSLFCNAINYVLLMLDGSVQHTDGTPVYTNSAGTKLLEKVTTIYSNRYSYAALMEDGTVFCFGNNHNHGSRQNLNCQPDGLSNVASIYSSIDSFTALRFDGTALSWGRITNAPIGKKFIAINSWKHGFWGLEKDGTVEEWGTGAKISSTSPDAVRLLPNGFVLTRDNRLMSGTFTMSGVRTVFMPNYYTSESTVNNLQACPMGTYGGGWLDCQSCPNVSGNAEAPATLGLRTSVSNCLECVYPKYSSNGIDCDSECAAGFKYIPPTFFEGVHQCYKCDKGKYWDVSVGCKPCSPGRYSNITDATTCELCPKGTYSFSGQIGCTSCGSTRTTRVDKGASSPASCYQKCIPGWYGESQYCIACAEGKYSNNSNAYDCDMCSPGKYISATNASHCLECAPGKFSSQNGAKFCIDCPADSVTSTYGSIKCTLCSDISKFYGTGTVVGATNCSVRNSVRCNPGYSESKSQRDSSIPVHPCSVCPCGKYSNDGISCKFCEVGTYSLSAHSECTKCPLGRHGIETSNKCSLDSSCSLCVEGKYQSFIGAITCIDCPPGSYCDKKGMNSSSPCDVGTYASKKKSTSCKFCPSGHYQNQTGSASCELCSHGTHNNLTGSVFLSACSVCERGKFSSLSGAQACSPCPDGYYQPDVGMPDCNNCKSDFGATKTSNVDHTACVTDSSLLSASLLNTLFDKGAAWYGAGAMAGLFLALVGVLQLKREKSIKPVGTLSRFEVVLKSIMPGFTFGSELFLIVGIFKHATILASFMLSFRLLHMFGGLVVVATIFGSRKIGRKIESLFLEDASHLHEKTEGTFFRENIPFFGVLMILSMCDVTMLVFMPWQATRFFNESKGYPTLSLMKFCMRIKTTQSLVSVVCQIMYLIINANLNDPTTSPMAKFLFAASITVNIIGVTLGLVLLLMKQGLLSDVEEKERKNADDTSSEVECGVSNAFGQGEEYPNSSEIPMTDNPMMITVRRNSSDLCNTTIPSTQIGEGIDAKSVLASVPALSVEKDSVSLETLPSAERRRLAGFAIVSSKRNSLDRSRVSNRLHVSNLSEVDERLASNSESSDNIEPQGPLLAPPPPPVPLQLSGAGATVGIEGLEELNEKNAV